MEAFKRFFNPLEIRFEEAILVAIIGLVVNVICILIMEGKGHHHHCNHAEHDNEQTNDYNFKAAYLHILADALTSVFAIGALLAV